MSRSISRRTIPPVPALLASMFLFGAVRLAAATDTTEGGGGAAGATSNFSFHETKILGTSLDLQVCAATQGDADRAHAAVMGEVERLRKLLSTYEAETELGKVNAVREPVKVSPEVMEVLKLYDQWRVNSKGAFSGRLGGLVAVWKDAAKQGEMPAGTLIAGLAAAEKNPLWKLDGSAGTVQRLTDETINIDSLGKGFIVSRAAAVAKDLPGVRGLLLNVGGDITAVGTSSITGIEEWKVGIADPANPAENAAPLASVKITGRSIATSGSYARTYNVGGTKLSHIVDPRNGYPIDSADAPEGKRDPVVVSATVIAGDNAGANALATSLCVLSPAEGLALISATPGAEALLVLSDGKQVRSPGFARHEAVSTAAADTGWENGYEVALTFQQNTAIRERPYMAFWVEDASGQHVVTLGEWGNNTRWVKSLSSWFRHTGTDKELIRTVSRATRQAGKYTLVWDGKDQAGNVVPAGTYKICVEAAYDHNGHSISSGTIVCGDKATDATMPGTQHFEGVTLTYAPKGN